MTSSVTTRVRRDRRPLWVLAVVALMTLFALAGASSALAAGTDGAGSGSTAPWIQSDLGDYAPGSTVTLTGGNWMPGETVHVFVDDTTNHTWNHSADVVADDSGMIQDVFALPNVFVSDYDVTATGGVGHRNVDVYRFSHRRGDDSRRPRFPSTVSSSTLPTSIGCPSAIRRAQPGLPQGRWIILANPEMVGHR